MERSVQGHGRSAAFLAQVDTLLRKNLIMQVYKSPFLDFSCFLWIWGYYGLIWMVGKCMDRWSNRFIFFCLIRLVEHKVICFCSFSWILALAALKFYFSVWFFPPHRFEVIMILIWTVGNCMNLWSNELVCCCLIQLITQWMLNLFNQNNKVAYITYLVYTAEIGPTD